MSDVCYIEIDKTHVQTSVFFKLEIITVATIESRSCIHGLESVATVACDENGRKFWLVADGIDEGGGAHGTPWLIPESRASLSKFAYFRLFREYPWICKRNVCHGLLLAITWLRPWMRRGNNDCYYENGKGNCFETIIATCYPIFSLPFVGNRSPTDVLVNLLDC